MFEYSPFDDFASNEPLTVTSYLWLHIKAPMFTLEGLLCESGSVDAEATGYKALNLLVGTTVARDFFFCLGLM